MKILGVFMIVLSYPMVLIGAVGIYGCSKRYFFDNNNKRKRRYLLLVYLAIILFAFGINFWGAKIGQIRIPTF